jgi:Arc/MetJ family transcription regulator
MRIHAVIDDELLQTAQEAYPNASSRTALLEEALRALVERSASRDLARMIAAKRFGLRRVPRRRGRGRSRR